MLHGWRRTVTGFLIMTIGASGLLLADDSTTELMRAAINSLKEAGSLEIGDASLATGPLLVELYGRRDDRLAWTHRERVEELLRLLAESEAEGLDPQDYNLSTLTDLNDQLRGAVEADPAVLVGFDLLLTDSLARLGYHMRFGKVVPDQLDPNWNFGRKVMTRDVVQFVQDAIDSDSLASFIREVSPRHGFYLTLKQALAEYREIAASGGWTSVPGGATLGPGDRGKRVRLLRARLDLAPGEIFDAELEQAVREFQQNHGLEMDGRVGKNTLRAINVPVESRIDQIRVNLERARWVFRDIDEEGEFVLVNIAGFRVYYVDDREVAWTARAQVGKTYRKTPVFRGKIQYLELNPTWTVPPTILAKDILPAVRKEIGYLERKNMSVLDASGRKVDPLTIDWQRYAKGGFPYAIRQDPGPNNALGRIKFIFPNSHFVFLHDTPSRDLFSRSRRAFSSGCIRVERPFELAAILLDDPEQTRERMLERVGGATERMHLAEPVTVMILYMTAGAIGGDVQFLEDVYGRDSRVLDALDGDFKIVAPSGLAISWPMDN
ncbi:MAG: murein L,D-transpeptidase [Actinobacteria bacterium]|nr:MAG: murein L,D-transpeptidase [Actinomycetota bacterium]